MLPEQLQVHSVTRRPPRDEHKASGNVLENHRVADLASNWIVSGDLCPEDDSETDFSGRGQNRHSKIAE